MTCCCEKLWNQPNFPLLGEKFWFGFCSVLLVLVLGLFGWWKSLFLLCYYFYINFSWDSLRLGFCLACLVWLGLVLIVCRFKYLISGKCFVILFLLIYFLYYIYFIQMITYIKQVMFGPFMHTNRSIVSFLFHSYQVPLWSFLTMHFHFVLLTLSITFLSLLLYFE